MLYKMGRRRLRHCDSSSSSSSSSSSADSKSDSSHIKHVKKNIKMDLLASVPNVINSQQNGSVNGRRWIPPDPSASVGPERVIAIVNASIKIYNKKTLEELYFSDGASFVGISNETHVLLGDVWTFYDEIDQRFWVMGFSFPEEAGNGVQINIAVSKDSNPSGPDDFYTYKYTDTQYFIDYPKFAADKDALYMGSWDFGETDDFARLLAFEKSNLLKGKGEPKVIYKENFGSTFPYGSLPFPVQPRPGRCNNVNQVLVVQAPESDEGVGDEIVITYVKHIKKKPVTKQVRVKVATYRLGERGIRQAPPLTNPFEEPIIPIENIPITINNGVLADDMLWLSHNVLSEDDERYVARWYQIDVSKLYCGKAKLVQQGNVDDGVNDIYYSAINVDKHGNMGIEFCISGPYQWPAIAYTGRLNDDPKGTVRFPLRYAIGGDLYYQTTAGGGRNRYGDYTALAMDPSDHETFWIFNEYPYPVPVAPEDDPQGRAPFGALWNTYLGAFKVLDKSGKTLNYPQRENLLHRKKKDHKKKDHKKEIKAKTVNTAVKKDGKMVGRTLPQ